MVGQEPRFDTGKGGAPACPANGDLEPVAKGLRRDPCPEARDCQPLCAFLGGLGRHLADVASTIAAVFFHGWGSYRSGPDLAQGK